VRALAATAPNVRMILNGMRGMDRGLDEFYILRGAKVMAIPSVVRANPISLGLVRMAAPRAYEKLMGTVPHEVNETQESMEKSPTLECENHKA